ncbi:hypothetical protein ACHAXR_004115 [Thalassiosira sp. AJA248-18]
MSNTATKTKAASTSGGGNIKSKSSSNNSNSNPKKNPKPKPKKQPPNTQKPTAPPKLAIDPPLECTKSDFEALLGDAANLSNIDEASTELLDCARYGEVDACRAILDVWSSCKKEEDNDNDNSNKEDNDTISIVNSKDASQSTSLHKSCANGHTSTVQLLLSRGAIHEANDSGNTPLHWAAGSGHAKCVKLLLDHYDALWFSSSSSSSSSGSSKKMMSGKEVEEEEGSGNKKQNNNNPSASRIDVLTKNNFGRSALTEGFASGDTKTVEHLLNHDSAEEEKLIGGLDKKEVGEEEAGEVATGNDSSSNKGAEKKNEKKNGIIHEFDFLRGNDDVESEDDERPSVLIRELPIAHADDPFGQAPIEDTTGLGIWCASLVMSRWLASPSMVQKMQNKSILELGAGCGIPALTAAVHGTPKSVIITDLNPDTMDNVRYNIDLNNKKWCGSDDDETTKATTTTASSIDWGDESTYPSNKKLDYVICSDCIYQKDIVPLLKKVVTGLLDPNHGSFLYVAPEGGRDGLPEFIAAMKSEGFDCVYEEVAPDVYRENPLKSGDEEDCFLHFHELASTVYVLYEFQRR